MIIVVSVCLLRFLEIAHVRQHAIVLICILLSNFEHPGHHPLLFMREVSLSHIGERKC